MNFKESFFQKNPEGQMPFRSGCVPFGSLVCGLYAVVQDQREDHDRDHDEACSH